MPRPIRRPFTGAANADISNAAVSVTADSWQHANGNAGSGGSTGNFVVDTVAMTVLTTLASFTVNSANGADPFDGVATSREPKSARARYDGGDQARAVIKHEGKKILGAREPPTLLPRHSTRWLFCPPRRSPS
jgi:hypothetical protein